MTPAPSLAPLGSEAESLRTYLLFVAEQHLDRSLQAKASHVDLVQDAMLAGLRAAGRFRGGTAEEYRGWLRRILVNLIHDHHRRFRRAASRERPLGPGVAVVSDDTPARLVADEQRRRVAEAVAALPEEYRLAVTLRYDEGHTLAEVGARLGGRSEDAARMLLARAVGRLRAAMRDDAE